MRGVVGLSDAWGGRIGVMEKPPDQMVRGLERFVNAGACLCRR